MALTRHECEVAAARAETYPRKNGSTFIAGQNASGALQAAELLRTTPALLEAG